MSVGGQDSDEDWWGKRKIYGWIFSLESKKCKKQQEADNE